jgi:ribosomal protein S17E
MFEDITDSDFYSDFLAFEQDFDDNKALVTEFVEPG